MATVNTASLRSEFDALKARFETLCVDGAMSAESRGSFPDDMPGPLQYGHGILAFATHLMVA